MGHRLRAVPLSFSLIWTPLGELENSWTGPHMVAWDEGSLKGLGGIIFQETSYTRRPSVGQKTEHGQDGPGFKFCLYTIVP